MPYAICEGSHLSLSPFLVDSVVTLSPYRNESLGKGRVCPMCGLLGCPQAPQTCSNAYIRYAHLVDIVRSSGYIQN